MDPDGHEDSYRGAGHHQGGGNPFNTLAGAKARRNAAAREHEKEGGHRRRNDEEQPARHRVCRQIVFGRLKLPRLGCPEYPPARDRLYFCENELQAAALEPGEMGRIDGGHREPVDHRPLQGNPQQDDDCGRDQNDQKREKRMEPRKGMQSAATADQRRSRIAIPSVAGDRENEENQKGKACHRPPPNLQKISRPVRSRAANGRETYCFGSMFLALTTLSCTVAIRSSDKDTRPRSLR